MTQTVSCMLDNRICRQTLDRPEKLNALDLAVVREIATHLDALDLHLSG